MRAAWCGVLVAAGLASAAAQAPPGPQTWNGVLSDSTCGASHAGRPAPDMTDRECAFHCVRALAKYVLVSDQQTVVPIVNQEFAGLPLRLARPVRVTGTLTEKGIVISRIEPPLVHSHLGHVMVAWRDTPGTVGLLTVALSDTRVGLAHAQLTAKAETLDDLKVHAAHVLHALDPAVEPKGPASGYGVRRAVAGAIQHVGFAAEADGAGADLKEGAANVTATLTGAGAGVDRAAGLIQKIRGVPSASEGAVLARELLAVVTQIGAELDRAQQAMRAMMKSEGL